MSAKLTFNDLPEAVHFLSREVADLKDLVRQLIPSPAYIPTSTAPILSSQEIKQMTGWPDGTFYQKVAEMPDGVVIRGKSKRLLFDREKFVLWLKSPVTPINAAVIERTAEARFNKQIGKRATTKAA